MLLSLNSIGSNESGKLNQLTFTVVNLIRMANLVTTVLTK